MLIVLVIVLAALWLGVLGYRDLVPTDEGRYAEIPREMVATGNWITPRLDGLKYFEKPPLQYWATAVAYEAFGVGQWQARLWTGLTGFFTILLTGYAGWRVFGARTGLYAAATLASSLYWVAMGHINTLDMGVSAMLSGSLLSFLLAQRDGASRAQMRHWMWACWAFMALALLSKGLIGPAFPGMTLVIYTLITRDWGLWKRLHIVTGLLIFLAIGLPWHVLVQLHNPEFFDYYFIYQQFTRFLTPELARPGPWWYFFPIALLGVLPWVGGLFTGLAHAWKQPRGVSAQPVAVRVGAFAAMPARPAFKPGWALLIWTVFIFAFFSASHSKLPSYILPIFPALALMIGDQFAHSRRGALGWQFALYGVISLAAAVGFTQLWRVGNAITPGALYQQYGWWLEITAACGIVGSALAWRWESRGQRSAAVLAMAISMFLGFTVAAQGFQILGRTASTKGVVAAIRPWLHAGQPFYAVGTYDQTLPFYLRRTVTVVQYQGELHFGITQQPQLWVPTLADFARRWQHDVLPLAFMSSGQLPALRAMHLPLQVIEQTTRYVVIAKPGQNYGAAAQAAAAHLPSGWNMPNGAAAPPAPTPSTARTSPGARP
jgi:4-amino-4-deoxy-L-arabinose transferase-like glycosyltransferase